MNPVNQAFIYLTILFISFGCNSDDPTGSAPTPYDFEAPTYFGEFNVPSDNQTTEEGVNLGRMLFYEPMLSGDNSQSCASCHQIDKAFTDGRKFGVGIEGLNTERSTMSLANLMWTNRYFWDGRGTSIEEIVANAVEDPVEMNDSFENVVSELNSSNEYVRLFQEAFGEESISEATIRKALAQFVRTMISSDSRYDQYLREEIELTDSELQGMQLFFTHPDPTAGVRGGNCGDCHSNFLTSGFNRDFDGFHNNGLDSEENLDLGLKNVTGNDSDLGKFKTPTLRNIELTAPYMHDGRFESLEEVLDQYNDHIQNSSTLDILILEASNEEIQPGEDVKLHLTEEEKIDIIAFLRTLTDDQFVSREELSNPFQ